MKDIIKISVVNFHTCWGNKEANLQKILDYVRIAGREGSDLIVFPEMALTGYDAEPGVPEEELMQRRLAETIPGPATDAVSELARKYEMYVIFGMPERVKGPAELNDKATGEGDGVQDCFYISAAICAPDGTVRSYRKMHHYGDDFCWAERGREPLVFDTPWGPVGVSICYDTFNFPELMQYTRAMGGRLHINCSANAAGASKKPLIRTELEGQVLQTWGYVASANLCGKDLFDTYFGGSSILGPSVRGNDLCYYGGHPYYSKKGKETGMYSAVIDLRTADEGDLPVFRINPKTGEPDYTAEVNRGMNGKIAERCRSLE